jgi:acetyltransferase-like isoleucine patch superfamily enzyme
LIEKKAVWIEDDVYIGPSVTILKGVRIGKGAFIEPGSMVTRDVPALTRVLGNPARVVGVL